jgi:hypothetical protein
LLVFAHLNDQFIVRRYIISLYIHVRSLLSSNDENGGYIVNGKPSSEHAGDAAFSDPFVANSCDTRLGDADCDGLLLGFPKASSFSFLLSLSN